MLKTALDLLEIGFSNADINAIPDLHPGFQTQITFQTAFDS